MSRCELKTYENRLKGKCVQTEKRRREKRRRIFRKVFESNRGAYCAKRGGECLTKQANEMNEKEKEKNAS